MYFSSRQPSETLQHTPLLACAEHHSHAADGLLDSCMCSVQAANAQRDGSFSCCTRSETSAGCRASRGCAATVCLASCIWCCWPTLTLTCAHAAWHLQLAAVTCTWRLLSDYPRSGACKPSRAIILEAAMGAASTGQRLVGRAERCRDTVRASRVRRDREV